MSFNNINQCSEESQRKDNNIMNDIVSTNKCLDVLFELKSFIDSIFDKIKHNLEDNEFSKYTKLCDKVKEVLDKNDKHMVSPGHSLGNGSRLSANQLEVEIKQEVCDDSYDQQFEELDDQTIESDLSRSSSSDVIQPKTTIDKKQKKQKNEFECDLCCKSYSSKSNLIYHKNYKHKCGIRKLSEYKRTRICEVEGCGRKFTSRLTYDMHIMFHTSYGPVICPKEGCDKTFQTEAKLFRHIDTHQKNKEDIRHIACDWPGCDYKDQSEKTVERHKLLVHTPEEISRTHECQYPGCGKKFKLKSCLNSHHKTHLTDQQVICDLCGRTFKNPYSLGKHKKMQHVGIKNWVCDHPGCDFKALYQSGLALHKAFHSDSRPFACTVKGCAKRFQLRGTLTQHMESHRSEANFICEFEGCGKKFLSQSRMRQHVYVFHSDTEVKCEWPGCDYVAKTVAKVNRHRVKHETERNFLCEWPECGKDFKTKAQLKIHMCGHTNDKRYVCQWPGCQYKTANSGNFVKHRRRVHLKNCPY